MYNACTYYIAPNSYKKNNEGALFSFKMFIFIEWFILSHNGIVGAKCTEEHMRKVTFPLIKVPLQGNCQESVSRRTQEIITFDSEEKYFIGEEITGRISKENQWMKEFHKPKELKRKYANINRSFSLITKVLLQDKCFSMPETILQKIYDFSKNSGHGYTLLWVSFFFLTREKLSFCLSILVQTERGNPTNSLGSMLFSF